MKVRISWGCGEAVVEMNPAAKLAPNFTLKELANNKGDASLPQFEITTESAEFLRMLTEFRKWYNHSMTINSCFRQAIFNASVGGDAKSAHLHACAVDWAIKGHGDQQRANVAACWKRICQVHRVVGSVNYYTNGYHLEAFSDKWYGQNNFAIRDYRKTKGDW